MARVNRQIALAAHPVGFPRVSDFSLTYSSLRSPVEGEVLVRSVYLSLDPFQRLLMNGAHSTLRPIAIGEVMVGAAVAIVVESKHPAFRTGEAVVGMLGWQEHAIIRGHELRKLDPQIAPISTALGVLGMPGLAAYFGMLDIGDPIAGETAVVAGFVGAVGMLAGQIAKIVGCRVVGVAGSDAKASWLRDEMGFDAVLNSTTAKNLGRQLAALCPDGIDVYFDNVGGATTDAVVRQINFGARIAICGQSSQDNLERPEKGARWLGELVVKQARVHGFQAAGYALRFAVARRKLVKWLHQGKLKYREDVAQGLEAAPQAFLGMLQGKSLGKQLVQLANL